MKPTTLRKKNGQAMVEAALAFPVLLAFTFMVTDVGYGYYVQNSLNNIARDTARRVSSDPRLNPNYASKISVAQTTVDKQQAVTDAVNFANTKVNSYPGLNSSPVNINVDVPGVNAPGNVVANPVEVQISRNVNFFTSAIVGGASLSNVAGNSASFVEATAIATVDPNLLIVDNPDIDGDGIPNDTDPDFKSKLPKYLCKQNLAGCDPDVLCQMDYTKCKNYGQLCKYQPAYCTTKYDCSLFGNNCSPALRCQISWSWCTDPTDFCTYYSGACTLGVPNPYYDCVLFGNGCSNPDVVCQRNWSLCADATLFCTYYSGACTLGTPNPYYNCLLYSAGCTSDLLCQFGRAACDINQNCKYFDVCTDANQRCAQRGVCIGVGG